MNIPIRDLFIDVLKKTGVMFTPISALDVEGSIRISCADALHITEEGLIRFSAYLKKYAWQFIYHVDFNIITKIPKKPHS